jgi:hypothetical protein
MTGSRTYIHILPSIVINYNNTTHDTTGSAPILLHNTTGWSKNPGGMYVKDGAQLYLCLNIIVQSCLPLLMDKHNCTSVVSTSNG